MRQKAWALWLAAAVFVVAWAPAADGDIWWHLAAGREMVRTRGLLWTDPFSSGAAGRPWIDVHWLFQIAAFVIHAAAGLGGLVIVKCALVAAGAVILGAAVVESRATRPAAVPFAVAFVTALFLTRHLLLLRPVIPTLLLLAVFFRRLESFRGHGQARALLALPLLQIVWANLQGLAALGPALVAAYAAGAAIAHLGRRRWPALAASETGAATPAEGAARLRLLGICLALCLLACLCTPFGVRGPILAGKLFLRLVPLADNVYSANIVENLPPWSLDRGAGATFSHLGYFLALFVGAVIVGWRRLPPSHALLAVALVGLALIANRNVLLLYWLGTPIATLCLAPGLRALRVWALRRWRRGWRVAIGVAVALPVGLSALVAVAALREPTVRQPAPWRACVRSADILDGKPGPGTVFAADNWGGYLIWRLYPRFRPYMDTRLVLRSADEFAEYLALADQPESFDAWEQRFAFDHVVLPTAYPDRYLGLVAHLYASPRWSLVFTDGTETLFARADATPVDQRLDLTRRATTLDIASELDARFDGQPRLLAAARLQLAILELAVGAASEAEVALQGMESPDAALLRAHARLALDDAQGAEAIASTLLRADPRDVAALDLLAGIALRRGDVPGAIAYLRRALAVEPDDSQALQMLLGLEQAPGGARGQSKP